MNTSSKIGFRYLLSLSAFCALIAAVTIAFADAPNTRTQLTLHKGRAAVRLTPADSVRLAEAPSLAKSKKVEAAASTSEKKTVDGTLNLNIASAEELVKLPGVGPKKAALIVAWRTQHGKFERVVDLRRVKGFGAKTVKKLMPYLAVSGKSSLH